MRRFAKILLLASAALVVLATFALSTGIGQSALLGLAARLASDTETRVSIGTLKGSLLGSGSIDEISISDPRGPWLRVRGLAFSWSPARLLAGRLAVTRLAADSLEVLRKPEPPRARKASSERPASALPLRLSISNVDLPSIDLAEELAGERIVLSLAMAAEINDLAQPSTGQLRLQRLNGATGELTAEFSFVPAGRALDLRLAGAEPEGGIVAGLLGLPQGASMSAHVDGRGTLDAWQADLALAARGSPFLAGTLRFDAAGKGAHRLSAEIAGFVEQSMPRALAEIFAGETKVRLAAGISGLAEGAPRALHDVRADITSANAYVAMTGGADLATGYVHGDIEGRVGRADGAPLPVGGDATAPIAARELTFRAAVPDVASPRRLTLTARLGGIVHPQLRAETIDFAATAAQPDPAGARARVVDDIALTLAAHGIDETTSLGKAVGSKPLLTATAAYDGRRLEVRALDIATEGAGAQGFGSLDGSRVEATLRLSLPDLSRFADLAARPLAGEATLDGTLEGDLATDALRVKLLAKSSGIATGIAALDGLLRHPTAYRGRLESAADGTLAVRDVSVANEMLDVALHGKRSKQTIDLSGQMTLLSLSAVEPSLAGKARLDLQIGGSEQELRSNVTVSGEGMTLNGKPIDKPVVAFAGRGPLSRHAGTLDVSGKIAGETLAGQAAILLADSGAVTVDRLALEVAGAKLDGAIDLGGSASPTGRLAVDAESLARLGNALGVPLKGRVRGSVTLAEVDGKGVAKLNVAANDLAIGDLRIGSLRSAADITNYIDAPGGTLTLDVSGIAQGARALGGIALEARAENGTTRFRSHGRIEQGAFDLSGKVLSSKRAHDIEIATLSYTGRTDLPPVRLAAPARFRVDEGALLLQSARLSVGDGALAASGTAKQEVLDLKVVLDRVPASIASVAVPELGVLGSISGTAAIKGAASNPQLTARVTASVLSVAEMRARQLPAADISTDITAANGTAEVKLDLKAQGGLALSLSGTVGYEANGKVALASRGTVPLSLANVLVADRAMRIAGAAVLTADISGPTSDPRIDGRISVEGATLADAELGLDLTGIGADIGVTQERVAIRKLVATSKKGGTVSAEGAVVLGRGTAPSVDAAVRLAAFKFGNQEPVAAEVNGDVRVSGPVNALAATGDVLIARMDITVPNSMPQSVNSLDIRHVNAPAHLRTDHSKKGRAGSATPSQSAGMPISLALDIRAHDRIFVRGRGVDAQLGGAIRVSGTASQPFTDGQFTMSRGRLAILGRQLDFSRGNILFTGGLEPSLDMEAQALADGTTVSVRVSGPASKPKLTFSSSPDLPEDEIVSLLLFNRQLASLSPAQLVQLAGEVDKIGGLSSGPGALDKMKSALGIDVLDVTTDEKGRAQATAGSYIDEKTYVGVKQGTDLGKSRIVIDHELTKNIKARGEVGTDGGSKLGIGVEWNY